LIAKVTGYIITPELGHEIMNFESYMNHSE
jgi:hypothetical protein